MKKKKNEPSKNELRLLALIAYRAGEISEGRCVELAGISRDKIREEMHKRCGMYSPYDQAIRITEGLALKTRLLIAWVRRNDVSAALDKAADIEAYLDAHGFKEKEIHAMEKADA